MNNELLVLCATAASLGFIHTVVGPDHYLPFIALSRARGWSIAKTLLVTALCGAGHILSSVALGFLGIMLGVGLSQLEFIEAARGEIAGYLLIAFGFIYLVWGLVRAIRNKPHRHLHAHDETLSHSHEHRHEDGHVHVHDRRGKPVTPWALFIIFAFGPCEPLIPLLMYPAARQSAGGVAVVAAVFGAVTIATMLVITLVSSFGLKLIVFKPLERWTHALAGGTILLSGIAVSFLGI